MKPLLLTSFLFLIIFSGCGQKEDTQPNMTDDKNFKVQTEQFADLAILRYRVPGFEELTPKQKELVYYLYEAALAGRDIIYDQNYKYNLTVRRTLEAIVAGYQGDKTSDDWNNFMIYTKRVWFSNGIHHHYSNAKIMPDFSFEYFSSLVNSVPADSLPLPQNQTAADLLKLLEKVIFDPNTAPTKVNKDPGKDLVQTSAVNFYEGVSEKEVDAYYKKIIDPKDDRPVSYGLNSKLVKENGVISEKVWKVGGMYSPAIERIVYWLENAVTVAETDIQKKSFQKLIEFYKTGNLRTFDEYNIEWVKDTEASVDAINGFIETYNDPMSMRANYEAVVSFKDLEATKRIKAISDNAQWFEDNSPIMDNHKKDTVVGISAKVITVVVESGDASPSTPIGINLPNANWIRKEHGSKSVNLGNIVHAYNMAASEGMLQEFCYSPEEIERQKKYGALSDDLHTDMHEVIGHASGQINPGVGTPRESLKSFASTIEETRADLVALWYILDRKLIDIGVMPDLETGKAEYEKYIRNGLMTQLTRIKLGDNVEQDHMRNRQIVAAWAFEKGKAENVIEKKVRDGKTFFVVNDHQKLRSLFGQLLREVQRITSEGDYKAAQKLVETYGVKIDYALHKEILERYAKLNIAPYKGFINPVLIPVYEGTVLKDVKVEYPDDFTNQMLYYARKYSYLPSMN